MSLETYKSKRNFTATPEPEGKIIKNKKLSFAVQRHHASHLHYDFRLEMDGVLKSWAVPKGPSLNSKDKRLAMMVEDHPFDYLDFEGEIPSGNYGAGTVQLWDIGQYELIKNSPSDSGIKQIKKGSIKFILYGKKLKGEFALVKLKDDKGKNNSWLLIKHADQYATTEPYSAEDYIKKRPAKKQIVDEPIIHIKKNRKIPEYVNAKSTNSKNWLYKPMLAYLTNSIPSSEDFLFEEKYDGYRAIADIQKNNVSLYSRNHKSFNEHFSIIIDELKKLKYDVVLDGELIVLNARSGKSTFEDIQNVDSSDEKDIRFMVFDILSLNKKDTILLPLEQRRELLELLLKKITSKYILASPTYTDGNKLFAKAQKDSLEGIMAKRKDSVYEEGIRSRNWLKIKISNTQDAIICGYTEPHGERKKFGSLILGIYDKEKLTYIGNCGTGFTDKTLLALFNMMKKYISINKPFIEKIESSETITWLRPEIVCEVKYSEWTGNGHLRHPVFIRIRNDKELADTTKEVLSKKTPSGKTVLEKPVSKKTVATKSPSLQKRPAPDNKELKVDGITLNLSNLNKIYWKKERITKGDLIHYYNTISDFILPYLKNRPLSLNRFPNGIESESFYQKDIDKSKSPQWLKTIEIFSESNQKNIDYLVCNNKATLLYMANLGCIEMNPWLSDIKHLNNPDFMVLDLDPGKISFDKVIDTAQACKEVLDQLGIKSYCKTSGSTGLHIYVHLKAKYDFNVSKNLAQLISHKVQAMLPKFTSIERTVSKRSDKIYIDFLQNRRGQTIASAFSCRPKRGATVSFPLSWKEVTHDLTMSDYTIYTVPEIINSSWKNSWSDLFDYEIDVNKIISQLEQ